MKKSRTPCVMCRRLIAFALFGFFLFSVSGAAAAFKNLKVGDKALPVELQDVDGRMYSLDGFGEAKAVLLFFWATWSDRSMREMDDLLKLEKQYHDQGLRVLAVNVENQDISDEDWQKIRDLIDEKTPAFPVVVDRGLKTYSEWGVIATPTTAIIDDSGSIVFDLSSYPTSAYLDMEEAIKKALGLAVETKEAVVVKERAYHPAKQAMLHFGLGKRHMEMGFISKALPELQKASVADSHYVEPRIYLGYALIRNEDLENASKPLEEALALDSSRRLTRLLMAYVLVKRDDLEGAMEYCGFSPPEEGAMDPRGLVGGAGDQPPPQESSTGGGTGESGDIDISRVRELKNEGRDKEALELLGSLIAGELEGTEFALRKKKKLDPMERMKQMMQQRGQQ